MTYMLIAAVVAVFLAGQYHAADAVDAPYLAGEQVGSVNSDPIVEASGLAASRRNRNVLWTHNDKGDKARIFAINTQGYYLGNFTLAGASHVDYEDIAVGPGPVLDLNYLFVGDIGNNKPNVFPRPSITVYRAPEPLVNAYGMDQSDVLSVDTLTLTYPDYARDAETLLVDPITGQLLIVTKEITNQVFRAGPWGAGDKSMVLQYMGSMASKYATGGDVSADGKEILIKGYQKIRLYHRSEGMDLADALTQPAEPAVVLPYEPELQGEAVGFEANGQGYFTLSESKGMAQLVPLLFYKRNDAHEDSPSLVDVLIKKTRITIILSKPIHPSQALNLENYVLLTDGEQVNLKYARHIPEAGGLEDRFKIILVTSSFQKNALLEIAMSRTLADIADTSDLVPGYAHLATVGSGNRVQYVEPDGDEFVVTVRRGGLVNFACRQTDGSTSLYIARTSRLGFRSVLGGTIIDARGNGVVLFDRMRADAGRTFTSKLDPTYFLAGPLTPPEADSLFMASQGTLAGVLIY